MPGLNRQAGFGLLASLVAVAILAMAVQAMLGVQLRTLADTRASVRRAQAVRLIEDFGERIKTHPGGYRLSSTHAAGWHAMPSPPDCRRAACDPESLALWDLAAWRKSVAETLPLGLGQVFEPRAASGSRHHGQLGVMVAWRRADRAQGDDALDEPSSVGAPQGAAPCPTGSVCHLAYVHP